MSSENKNIPVPCKMFLRFLKERDLFYEWRMEGENKIKKDSKSLILSSSQRFYSFADKWQWYITRSSTLYPILSDNQICNVIDYTLYWSCTKRGFSFWSNMHDYWIDLYCKYHAARKAVSVAVRQPMTDDLDTFRHVMHEFGKDYLHYA